MASAVVWWPGRRALLAAWVVGGALVLALAALPDVRRSQEARVLATAREMLIGGTSSPRAWVVPQLNGKPRLQKPPLAYWATAASFAIFGVGTWSGRVPAVLAAWLTVALTYDVARRLFDRRAGACAAAVLASSVLFVRFGAVAETDVWVALLTTAAVAALLRCFDDDDDDAADIDATDHGGDGDGAGAAARWRFVAWAHLAAAATGLIGVVKGAPLAYPLLFLALACAARRRWDVLGRWVRCGAPLTVALLVVPWFAYAATLPEWNVVAREARVLLGGEGHRGGAVAVAALLLSAAAPWSGIAVLAIAAAIGAARRGRAAEGNDDDGDDAARGARAGARRLFRKWHGRLAHAGVTDAAHGRDAHATGRADAASGGVATALAWLAAVLVPLLVIGQKQDHYAPHALPPIAVLTGWFVVRSIEPSAARRRGWPERAAPAVLGATLAVAAAAAVALPVAGYRARGRVATVGVAAGAAISLVAGAAFVRWRRHGYPDACAVVLAGAPPLVVVSVLAWAPSLDGVTYAHVAAELRRDLNLSADADLGARCAFYDEPATVPLCWAMRAVVPTLRTRGQAMAATGRDPRPALITASARPRAAGGPPPLPVPPPGYAEHRRYLVDGRPVVVYFPAAAAPSARPARPSPAP